MRSLLLSAFAVSAAAASCAAPEQRNRRPPRLALQHEAPPATVPESLHLAMSITDQPDPADGRNMCVVQLKRGSEPLRALADDELITCNGVSMPFNELVDGFAARVPAQPVGGEYSFLVRLASGSSRLRVPVPERPQLARLRPGAALDRGAALTIDYVPGGGQQVDVLAYHGCGSTATAGPQPDDGTYEGLNTQGFPPGPGTLRLSRRLVHSPPAADLGPARCEYEVSTIVDVVWR
jgi:hypothetical protein